MDDEYGSTKISISQTVTQEKIDERIKSLKSKLMILNEEVRELVLKENKFFMEMAKSYIQLKTDDLNDVEKWHDNSKRVAQIQYDIEIEIDENEYNTNKEKLDLRAKMLVKYKSEKLMDTIPEYAQYFQKFNLPFFEKMEEVSSFPDDGLSNPSILLTQESLLSSNEANQDLLLISQPKPKNPQYLITQKMLKRGKATFPSNSPVQIILPNKEPIFAFIHHVNQQGVTLKAQGNDNTFTISLLALNSGFATIQKC